MVFDWKCWEHRRSAIVPGASASLVNSENKDLNLVVSKSIPTTSSWYVFATSSPYLEDADVLKAHQRNHFDSPATLFG